MGMYVSKVHTERAIGFGLPLKAAAETPNLTTELNKEAGIGLGTPFLASNTPRQLDMEPLDRKSLTAHTAGEARRMVWARRRGGKGREGAGRGGGCVWGCRSVLLV